MTQASASSSPSAASAAPAAARVAIIGGGAVGTSALMHLARMGWTDCVLLEKTELTAGSTWHAAGNCPTFAGDWAVMRMQAYSADLFAQLSADPDHPISYHRTGSLRLAHDRERMREFAHVADMAAAQGREMRMLTVDEIKALAPEVETHDLVGGLWDPIDGDIDPSQLTQAYATEARALGARIVRGCPVTAVRREADGWALETPKGTVRCEIVVNAAGYYAQQVSRMFVPFGGRVIPQCVMAHQYLVTEPIAHFDGREPRMPLIRDPDASWYLRQEKTSLLLGPYENGGRIHWRDPGDPMPEDFSFQLYPDDLDRIESYIEDACARVPLLGSVGLQRVINGPIPYAPDGNPLIGPMPGVPDAFEACVFTFGIAQSGGAGKSLAEWVVEGETEWDMWSCDPRRFGAWADQDYADARGKEIYDHEYAIHFPHLQWPAGRGKRLSPLHGRLADLGAQFGPYGGWERAVWFAGPQDDVDPASCATFEREGPWFPAVARECAAVRDAAGVLELPGFSRFELDGPGAADWLDTLTASALPRDGRVGLLYFATDSGRFKTEMSAARRGPDRFLLITAAAAQEHDLEWLRAHMPPDAAFTLTDVTEETTALLVTGPNSREILARIVDGDLSLPWLSRQSATAAGAPIELMRVSYAGELGWELHVPVAHAAAVWDALAEAGAGRGLKPFGMYALDSLRLEKGYLGWKSDLTADATLLQLGLDRFVRLDKPAFVGKAALTAEAAEGPESRMVSLAVEAGLCDAPPNASVFQDGRRVGIVTSGGYGHRVGRSLALARVERAIEGAVEIDINGVPRRAEIQPALAQWDPANHRIRA